MMEIEFRTKNPKQIRAIEHWLDRETEQILYGGAKYGGKSYLGASLIFGDALIYPETRYFIAREQLTDLRKHTMSTIHEVFENWGLKLADYAPFNGQDNVYNLTNGSKVYLIDCKEIPSDPLFERFGSMQMTKGWIEEGGEVAESAYANLWLGVGRWKNDKYGLPKKLLITANPKKGWMKRGFIDLWKEDKLPPAKKFVQAFATDNVHGDKNYIESLRKETDTVRRQRLWEGNWDYDEDQNSLISFDALTDSFSNTIVKDNQKYLIIDVARLGKDSTTFNFWDGLELYRIDKFEKQTTDKTVQKAKDLAALESIPYSNILIDEDGIGGAIVDGMFGVKGFVANSRSIPTKTEIRDRKNKITGFLTPRTNFFNLKSQCGWKLAELINEHKLALKVPDFRDIIIEELGALLKQKDIDDDRKLQLIPKDEVKESLGRSPDIGDPLIMRAWFELKKEVLDEAGREDIVAKQDKQFSINLGNKELSSNK